MGGNGRLALATLLAVVSGNANAIAQHEEVPTVMALRGELIDGSIDIRGVVVESAAGAGEFHAARSDGVSCRGHYKYGDGSSTAGDGSFVCGSGQPAAFWFVRDGESILGCGVLDGRAPFRFVAGAAAFVAGYPQGFDCGAN